MIGLHIDNENENLDYLIMYDMYMNRNLFQNESHKMSTMGNMTNLFKHLKFKSQQYA